jgi:DNA invertase Pin-like site-specific DNA recombinase
VAPVRRGDDVTVAVGLLEQVGAGPVANKRARDLRLGWTLRDKVPTLHQTLNALVRARRAYDAGRLATPGESQVVRHKQIRRLTEAQIEDIAGQYRDGKTVYELAKVFGVHRTTVGAVLRRRGVDTSRQVLDESDRPEIERMRAEGWSYQRIGERLGAHGGTVRRFMRDR